MASRRLLYFLLKLLLGFALIGLTGCQARQSETLLFETIEKSHLIGYQDKSADFFILTRPEDINQDWLFDGGARLAAIEKQDGDWEREFKFELKATNRWFFGIEHTIFVP